MKTKNIKKAFSLSEVLIVLILIGVIAMIALPAASRATTNNRFKVTLKKAYATTTIIAKTGVVAGGLPVSNQNKDLKDFFELLSKTISINYYTGIIPKDEIIDGKVFSSTDFQETFNDYDSIQDSTPWLVAEDNIAYAVIKGEGCSSIEEINKAGIHSEAVKNACLIIVVDVNGINNAPNRLEPLTLDDNVLALDRIQEPLSDRFYLYVGRNGVTAGSRKHTIAGKIVSED